MDISSINYRNRCMIGCSIAKELSTFNLKVAVIDKKSRLAKIRFWYEKKLVGVKKVRNDNLNIPDF